MRKGEVDAEVTLPNSIYTTTIPTLAYCLRGSSTTIMRARGGRIEDAGAYCLRGSSTTIMRARGGRIEDAGAYCLRGSSTTIMRARGGRIEDAGAYMCIHLLNELRYQV